MKTYPHKPRESDLRGTWQNTLESYQQETEDVDAAARARKPTFFELRCDQALDLACLAYAFESPTEEVRRLLAEACTLAERAVEFGVKLNPILYMKYLSLSTLCQQEGFRKTLEGMQRQQYTNPNIQGDEIFYLGAEAMAALSAQKAAAAQELTTKALGRARSGQVNKLARTAMEPALLLEAAIADKDAQSLASAAEARAEELRSNYSQKAARGYPSGLLDVRGLGLLALARQHGIQPLPSNVYMPRELLKEMA